MKEGAKARGRILDVDKKAGVIDVSLRPEFVMSGEVPIPSPLLPLTLKKHIEIPLIL